ncbi:MAG: trigger factor [Andreesenia angusta]|nr:trigger factor [Andreesenia angusta]
MSSVIEKKENNIVTIKIEIPSEEFEKALNQAYIKNRGKFNIPGFRKGKAPRKIIEINYGKGIFIEEAVNSIFPSKYSEAIEKHNLEPVDRPVLIDENFGEDSNPEFTIEVTVKPEVKLGEYKGVEVEKIEYSIEDDAVENELKNIQDANSRLVEVEDRAVEEGDILTIDYKGFVGEEQFEGGTAENQELEIGSGSFIPGFEEQLIGKEVGEEVDVELTFPEEYHADELAGKDAKFEVKIHEIKVKESPEIDDELAKDVSEFDTLEELKEDIKNKLTAQKEEEAKIEMEDKVVEKACENAEIDIPEIMIENQIDMNVNDFAHRLSYQGIDIEKYLELSNQTMEDFRSQFAENAKKFVTADLVLEAIGKKEDIKATEEDLNEELLELSKQYGQDIDKLRQNLSEDDMEYLEKTKIKKKTIDFLVDNAKIV